jgi:hypothetical protein
MDEETLSTYVVAFYPAVIDAELCAQIERDYDRVISLLASYDFCPGKGWAKRPERIEQLAQGRPVPDVEGRSGPWQGTSTVFIDTSGLSSSSAARPA